MILPNNLSSNEIDRSFPFTTEQHGSSGDPNNQRSAFQPVSCTNSNSHYPHQPPYVPHHNNNNNNNNLLSSLAHSSPSPTVLVAPTASTSTSASSTPATASSVFQNSTSLNNSNRAIYNGVNLQYPGLQLLHPNPPIFAIHNFLSQQECEFLIHAASDSFGPAPVVGKGAGEVSPSRTSSTCYLAREDLPNLLRKVCLATGQAMEHCELPQVGRYLSTQQYLQHYDAFDLTTEDGIRFANNGGQRIVTCLLYLNTVPQGGGATHFPLLNLQIQPQQGMCVIFFPATMDGILDPMALHAALPAGNVPKFVSQVWIRQSTYHGIPSKRLSIPLGPPLTPEEIQASHQHVMKHAIVVDRVMPTTTSHGGGGGGPLVPTTHETTTHTMGSGDHGASTANAAATTVALMLLQQQKQQQQQQLQCLLHQQSLLLHPSQQQSLLQLHSQHHHEQHHPHQPPPTQHQHQQLQQVDPWWNLVSQRASLP